MVKSPVLAELVDVVDVTQDCASVAAERDLQAVLERLRDGSITRPQLAVLARAIAAELVTIERLIEAAGTDVQRERDNLERWIEHEATAADAERPDLADQARDRLAFHRAGVRSAEAVLFEYREAQAQLREVGRLVLDRVNS